MPQYVCMILRRDGDQKRMEKNEAGLHISSLLLPDSQPVVNVTWISMVGPSGPTQIPLNLYVSPASK